MKKILLISILSVLLVSCGEDYGFTENYNDSICVPANALTLDDFLYQPASSNEDTCCASSGLVSCCFGGSYICANGDTGVGCGCPSR